jgi:hypothetical protein
MDVLVSDQEEDSMSVNSGKPDDDRGENRDSTSSDPNSAAQKPGGNTGNVSQGITAGGEQPNTGSSSQQGQQEGTNQSVGQQTDTSAWQQQNQTQPQRQPGQEAPSLGQESGTDWQESQQAGYTGRTGVQNPQEK